MPQASEQGVFVKKLREYQENAIDALFAYLNHNEKGNPVIVAPVGAGKSLIITEFVKRIYAVAPKAKVIILTHVKELLEQNYKEMIEQFPTVDAGFYCDGLNQKRLHNDVIFASIQSIANKADRLNRVPNVLIIDETHLVSHKEDSTYRLFIADCLRLNPQCRVVGLTGTPFRADSGRITEGKGKLFDDIAYHIEIPYMLEQGFWAYPVTPKVETVLSVEGVGSRGGDYIESQLQKAVDKADKTTACVNEIMAHGAERRKWLIFTAGVDHCTHVRDEIRSRGIDCEMVTGETPKPERAAIIERYRRGEIRALVNVGVLTTGFNVPDIDLLAFMRPTRSPVLYIQCIGRGVRPVYAPGFDLSTQQGRLDAIAASVKKDVMVLDFGQIIQTLGPIDEIDIRKGERSEKKDKDEKAAKEKILSKTCPSCGTECAPQQRYCYSCSHSFVEDKQTSKASSASILSQPKQEEDHTVFKVTYNKHRKKDDPNAPPTMRVNYITDNGTFSEWVCVEHQGFAGAKARAWMQERLPNFELPTTVDAAIDLPWPSPDSITVKPDGKFHRIIKHHFSEDHEEMLPENWIYPGAKELRLDDEIPF